jgi:hypothetical protein
VLHDVVLLSDGCHVFGEAFEAAGPASDVVVAAFGGFEHGLMQDQQGLGALFRQCDGGEEFVAWISVGILPGEGEDNAFRLDELAVDADFPVVGALG